MLKRREFVRAAGLAAIGAVIGPEPALAQQDVNVPSQRLAPNLPNDLIYPDEATLAPPPKPFASNHNYYIYGGGEPILDLVVTIDIHEELVAPDAMSMQLNCSSPPGAGCDWQQFVTGMSSLKKSPTLLIGSSIENFPSGAYRDQLHTAIGFHLKGDLFNEHFHFGNFPAHVSGRIPAGWKIKWEVFTSGGAPVGHVIGAQYSVIHDHGQVQTSGPQMIKNFKFSGTKVPVAPEAMAPILALQMNMVGTNGGQFMHVQSGAGTITYESATKLVAIAKPPGLGSYAFTTETSNIRYAELSSTPSNKIVQKFRAMPGQ